MDRHTAGEKSNFHKRLSLFSLSIFQGRDWISITRLTYMLFVPGVDQHEQPVDRDQLLRQHCNLCHEGLQVPAGNLRREEIFLSGFQNLY